jgi:hypothetical protein
VGMNSYISSAFLQSIVRSSHNSGPLALLRLISLDSTQPRSSWFVVQTYQPWRRSIAEDPIKPGGADLREGLGKLNRALVVGDAQTRALPLRGERVSPEKVCNTVNPEPSRLIAQRTLRRS